MILVEGNAAGALGCMFAGVTVVAWYPITPSSSLPEALIGFMKKYRIDKETGKATYAIVQAEDEIASIGMVIGAGWAGARAMTSTSGPGISLMGEFAGLAYYAEIPGVVFDIQRVGPSTGLPTRTAQGDILSTALLSHGDTKQIMLLPASAEECYTMAMDAFDLAERFQTLVFVMSDLDLGMNTWMSQPFSYPERPLDRGKVLDEETLARVGEWGRYKDVDGDGIPYRTMPGTGMPAYFTRGSGHNDRGQYSERPDDYVHERRSAGAQVRDGAAIRAAADRRRSGRRRDRHHRLRVEPLGDRREPRPDRAGERPADRLPAAARLSVHRRGLGVHRPLRSRLRRRAEPRRADAAACCGMELSPAQSAKLRSVLHYNGLPIDARSITDDILVQEEHSAVHGPTAASASPNRQRWPPLPRNPRARSQPHRPRRRSRTAAARRRCAPAAATTPSPSASSTPSSRWAIDPRNVIKLSGIGCSSKSPAYFLGAAHGFNTVHGRMPSVGTGAMLANRTLIAIGVSGDGDTGAIGIGQFVHLMRRNVPIVYIIEDNGCYGLTKGQFSPTADLGSTLKNGVVNDLPPIDTCALAIQLGASFVARSFSGDKKQLLSILKASLSHRGTCMIDVLSPCVTFNDHEGSTKSYAYVKDHDEPLGEVSFVPFFDDIIDRVRRRHDEGSAAARRVEAVSEEGRGGLQPDRQAVGHAA